MRLAILSDIHGNSLALDAVLADIRASGGVDGYWVLGDLAALGPDPVGVLERVYNLPNAQFTRGNTDRYIATGVHPGPDLEQVKQDPTLLLRYVRVAQNFAWTMGALSNGNWLERLAALPLEQRMTLPDGTRMLGVHAAPGTDDGDGIHPRLSQAQLRTLLAGCEADLVFVGHTHWPMDVTVDGIRVINLGSVSNPFPPDLRAKYTLLEANQRGYRLEHRRVEYDREAAIAALERARHPAREYIMRYLRGQQRPAWSENLSAQEAAQLGLPAILVDSTA